MRRRRPQPSRPEGAKMDMSPMIDMVFLLIIFFMVASEFVLIRKDPDVEVPIAPKGRPMESARGRVMLNVYSDTVMEQKGRTSPFADVDSNELFFEDITRLVREAREENERAGVEPTILMLRGDHETLVRRMKEALQAAGNAGVNDIMFSALIERQ